MTPEMSTIICAIIVAIETVLVAIIEKAAHNDRKKAEEDRKRSQARAERRERESRLSMELMSANCELSIVTATAIRDGHTNGTLDPAVEKAKKARDDYESFLKDETARNLAKA